MIRFISHLMLVMLPGSLAAQTLTQRVSSAADGVVRLSFPARAGTCGDGTSGIRIQDVSDEWQPDCGPRLVRVALRLREHRVHSVRTYVGGHWRPDPTVLDLGTVSPVEAAPYFIGLAERSASESIAGDPLLPSVLADSVTVWPLLVRVARNPRLSRELRGRAVFWLGQAAGAAAGKALDSMAGDRRADHEVRKHAVFALSQRPRDEGVPALIRIARTSSDPDLRKTALFWLGQSEDPRALDLFEEILR
jgi:hypothetical protein